MGEFRVRKAVESDLQEIIRVWKQNIKTSNTTEDIAEFFHASEDYFFVAVSTAASTDDERIIGFIGGAIRGGHGHISGIAVDKGYRRQKIGEELIYALEHQFRTNKFDTVTLEVRKSEKGAKKFYEKLGFKPAYVVKKYYADDEDAFVCVKKI